MLALSRAVCSGLGTFIYARPLLRAGHSFSRQSTLLSTRRSYANMPELKQGEFVGSLDCGTTSTRFIIFDKYAKVVAQQQLEFPQYYPHPGWHEHDPEELQKSCEQCIDDAVVKLEELGYARSSVKVIGITNQRETTVAWSKKTGKSLCKAIVWDDARTKNLVTHYENKLKNDGIKLEDGTVRKGEDGALALQELTGLPLSTYFSAIKLCWMISNHESVREAHEQDDLLFGTVESWIVYNLTNRALHISDPTNASRTLLMDLRTLTFSPALLDFFGFRPSILPTIVSSSEVYASLAHGALKGTPIGGLVGDQQGALVGNKCLQEGEAKCTYGTGAFLLFTTGLEPVQSANGLLTTVAYQPGKGKKPVYALEGSIGVAGSAVQWLRDSMQFISSANEINELAASVESTGGVYFVTAFGGLLAPYWDPGAAGLLIGLSSYTTRGHIARAALEASAFQTKAVVRSMEADSKRGMKVLRVDGGMTNGDVGMQLLADVTGFEIVRPEMRESTALGSAILAGAAVGFAGWDLEKPETLSEVNTAGNTTFDTKTEEAEREKRWAEWEKAVTRSRGWSEGTDEA